MGEEGADIVAALAQPRVEATPQHLGLLHVARLAFEGRG